MARSRNKYSRAAVREKTRRRPRNQRSSRWFVVTVTVICIVGIVGITVASGVLSRSDQASAAPQPPSDANPAGDHWHAAFGINICGEWLTNPPTFETADGNPNVRVGIHTHGDGFIHIHPFYSSEAGDKATLGKFLKYGGWSASDSSLETWVGPPGASSKTSWSNGDKCPNAAGEAGKGKPGRVVFQVNCKTVDGNPSDHVLADQEVVAIGFLPVGEKLGAPPNAQSAPSNDGTNASAIDQKACRPSAANNPGVADTSPIVTPTSVPATTATTASK